MIIWPTQLPQLFLLNGLVLTPVSNGLVADPEAGEPMTRVMFTGDMDDVAGTIPLDCRDQAIMLRDFYRYTCKQGTLPWVFDDVLTKEAVTVLFMKPDGSTAPPRITSPGGDLWNAELQLRVLPA